MHTIYDDIKDTNTARRNMKIDRTKIRLGPIHFRYVAYAFVLIFFIFASNGKKLNSRSKRNLMIYNNI